MPNPVNRFDVIQRALRLRVSMGARCVMVCLAQHIRTSGRQARLTWVKIDLIADEVDLDRRQVRRHLDALEEVGAIQRWRQPNGYLYRIPPTWDEVTASDRSAKIPASPREEDQWQAG
jgi:DNA-binding transcriptional ArsR family regulator